MARRLGLSAVMAYHMSVPHRQTAPVSAGAIGWDASIGLHTNSDPWPEHECAQRLLRLTARSASFTVRSGCFTPPGSGSCVFGVGAAGGNDCQLGVNACWHMGRPTINTPTITRTTTASVTATTATTSAVASTVKHGKNGSNHSDRHKGHNHGAGLGHHNNRRYAKSWWQYWQR